MATNGGIIGKSNKTSFGKCTVTSKTSSGDITLQPGTRAIEYLTIGAGGGGGINNGGGGGGGAVTCGTGNACGTLAVTVGAGGTGAAFPAGASPFSTNGGVTSIPSLCVTSPGGGSGGQSAEPGVSASNGAPGA